MTRLWIVRAGAVGERELDAIAQGLLQPGFNDVGDLASCKDRNSIFDRLQSTLKGAGENQLRNYAAQLNQFVNVIANGDLIVLPRKLTTGVAIGKVTGPYQFDPLGLSRHVRPVKWLKEAMPREVFAQDLRHSFGAFMTICEVKRNEALARVEAVVAGGSDPGPLLNKQGRAMPKLEPDAVEASEVELDIEQLAKLQIVALIKSAFAGHGLAQLVAEILQIEGYMTKVSKPGPDGGVDILAAGGKLGLGEDRICVEVKSGDGAADQYVVLKLMGSVQTSKARTGLLVSLGGVNSAAQRVLDSEFFVLRLWQMPELLGALFRTYGQLSEETRLKLPLKQIWSPAPLLEG
jgi:restriction system protein